MTRAGLRSTSMLAAALLAVVLGSGAHAAEPSAAGGDAQSLFEAGNAKYFAGDYPGAVKAYSEIVTRFEIEDPALYHNLGNAYFRTGAYGSAILYYQRALKLEPDEALGESLDNNLDASRRTLQARYRQTSDDALVYGDPSGALYQASHVIGPTPLAILFALVWTGFFALLALRRLRPHARWPGRTALPVGIAAGILAFMVWAQVTTDADHRIGVVVADDAKLRDGPHETAKGKELPEGIEVRILEGNADWTQVELASGRRGWVEATRVKQI